MREHVFGIIEKMEEFSMGFRSNTYYWLNNYPWYGGRKKAFSILKANNEKGEWREEC